MGGHRGDARGGAVGLATLHWRPRPLRPRTDKTCYDPRIHWQIRPDPNRTLDPKGHSSVKIDVFV